MEGNIKKKLLHPSKIVLLFCIAFSCSSNAGNKKILSDISSNSYYIPLTICYSGNSYEVVIQNSRLYSILSVEHKDNYDLNFYVALLSPFLTNEKALELTEDSYTEIKPYILPQDWDKRIFELPKLFTNNIQTSPIDDELILIKQLINKGYYIYKDDETGLLVLNDSL